MAAHYRITNTVAEDRRAVQVFNEAEVKQLGGLTEHTRAEVAYFMDPQELLAAFKDMRQRGLDLTVIYHSHTHSPAYPSQTDIGLAYYPDAAYLIISFAGMRDHVIEIGETLADRLLIYDALEMKFRKVSRPKNPACPLCGIDPTIVDLNRDYDVSCSL